jgi:hypothetical protein
MKRLFLIFILLFWYGFATAKVTMTITPSKAQLGDTLQLTLTLDNYKSQALPDLTPLEHDFTIVGTQHSLSYSVINGTTHSINQWIILLLAKKQGVLTIPALSIGGESSAPDQVVIKAHHYEKENVENNDVLLRGEISQNNPFINEEIIYTVKLYSSQRLLEVEYQPPEIEDALLIPLGEGRRYHSTINDREYAVDEQQYAIFPQKSGELKLSPPTLNALVYDVVPRRIQRKAKPVTLTVKPSTQKHWLPAKQVTLTQHYDLPTTALATGDTVVRSITLEAVGVPAQLLPTIRIKNNKQYRAYSEKPNAQNTLRQQELVGTSTMSVTYVFNQAGQVTLPPVQLTWFNTQTGKQETAILPERTFTVTAKKALTTPAKITKEKTTVQPRATAPSPSHSIAWWIASLLAGAWIITLLLWWFYHRSPRAMNISNRSLLRSIKVACFANDPIQAQAALLAWATTQWPTLSFFNLNDIIKCITDNTTLKKQLQLLSRALYSQHSQHTWHGEELWRSIKSYRPKPLDEKRKRSELAPMYPNYD